jgi:hypothetical protein
MSLTSSATRRYHADAVSFNFRSAISVRVPSTILIGVPMPVRSAVSDHRRGPGGTTREDGGSDREVAVRDRTVLLRVRLLR